MRECLCSMGFTLYLPVSHATVWCLCFLFMRRWPTWEKQWGGRHACMHGRGVIRLVCFSMSFRLCFMGQLSCSIDRISSGFFITWSQFQELQLLVASTLSLSLCLSLCLSRDSRLLPFYSATDTAVSYSVSVSNKTFLGRQATVAASNAKTLLRAPWGPLALKEALVHFLLMLGPLEGCCAVSCMRTRRCWGCGWVTIRGNRYGAWLCSNCGSRSANKRQGRAVRVHDGAWIWTMLLRL